jgi:hypothetical protein
MTGKLDGTMCARRACTACGRTVWVLLSAGTCAPCRGFGHYDDDDTEENAMVGVPKFGASDLTPEFRAKLNLECSAARDAILQLAPVSIQSEATKEAFEKYLAETQARWGVLDTMEHECEDLSWDVIKKAREFFLPVKAALAELQRLLQEKLRAYAGERPSSPPPAFEAAPGWTYTVKSLDLVPIAGHVLNQKWVKGEVARQISESPDMPPDIPGLRFSRVSS